MASWRSHPAPIPQISPGFPIPKNIADQPPHLTTHLIRQSANIRSITRLVRAAVSPVLGLAPTPFNSSTTAWIIGCWMCPGCAIWNSSDSPIVSRRNRIAPSERRERDPPRLPDQLHHVLPVMARKAPHAHAHRPRREHPRPRHDVLRRVKPRLVPRMPPHSAIGPSRKSSKSSVCDARSKNFPAPAIFRLHPPRRNVPGSRSSFAGG